jgi:hypothetical protein
MLADGLARNGHVDDAAAIAADSLPLLATGGFAEYYDPLTGEGLGGRRFTWTAAMVADLLKPRECSGQPREAAAPGPYLSRR